MIKQITIQPSRFIQAQNTVSTFKLSNKKSLSLQNQVRSPVPVPIKITPPVKAHIISPADIYSTNDSLSNELFENKSIMIYSHYSKNDKVDSYNYYMINLFSTLVDNVFILSNLHKDKWNVLNSNVQILNYDFKSDFSNLYVFLMRHQTFLININQLFFINDSFLVADKAVFENKIKESFFSNKEVEPYQGLILSNCHNIHYQSYFICIQKTIITSFIEYFKKNSYPLNHEDAIHKYELGLSREFLNKNIKYVCYKHNPMANYPYEIIQEYGLIKRQQLLSTYGPTLNITYTQIQQLKYKYKKNNELVEFINNYSRK